MRRALIAAAAVLALLCGATASARNQGGFNGPSNKIELTFKIALFDRAADPDGCYPSPTQLVSLIRDQTKLRIGVKPRDKAVHRKGVVYVIERGTTCNRLRLAFLAPEGLYILDSDHGPVQPPGAEEKKNKRGGVGRLGTPVLVSKDFRLKGPNETQRTTVNCPGRSGPLGGGMIVSPPVSSDGEGVYPHSYERLGVQRGWHISATLIDPSPSSITPRQLTIQAVCATGITAATPSPHKTVFVKAGQTKTVSASCPRGQVLFSGGFQRTDFRNFGLPDGGGDWVTESRAIGPRTWRVSGSAFGAFGGELTAVAHCVAHKRPLLKEISGSTALPAGQAATATTPTCPKGRRLTSGGFSFNGKQEPFFAGGSVNRNGTWSATGYAYFGPAPSLTAYGYCLRV
ncbi:MAG: hypothetical protein ACRDK5_09290 [Solirubrobacterales bacterium]